MKQSLTIVLLLASCSLLSAQSRIAIINGTTNQLKSTTSIDSALQLASDGDFIYLPGGNFPAVNIEKRVFIFGAGIYPDSTGATGRTVIASVYANNGASGGAIAGCTVTGSLAFGDVENFIVNRCYISEVISTGSSKCFFIENIINQKRSGYYTNKGSYNTFKKNIIGWVEHEQYSNFQNNIFLNLSVPLYSVIYSTFQNNIFLGLGSIETNLNGYPTYNNFQNNLARIDIPTNEFNMGNKKTTLDKIFLNFDSTIANPYTQDFHLKTDSPGKKAGSDGTDVGIYGTNEPTKAGWVPGNPHISLKNISSQTVANGYLKATFKVKAQNN